MSASKKVWVRKHRVVTAVFVACVTTLALGGYLVHQQTAGYWSRLAAAKSQFEQANGLMRVPEYREGSTVCVITCGTGGEAAISAMYEFRPASTTEAQREVARYLDAAFGDPAPVGFGDVVARTPLPAVGRGAYVQAESQCPDKVMQSPRCTMTVRFVSGIE